MGGSAAPSGRGLAGPRELLEVEGVPAADRPEPVCAAGLGALRQQRDGLGLRERPELEALDVAAARGGLERRGHAPATLPRAVREREHEAARWRPVQHVREDLDRGLIRPVHVVEDQQQPAPGRQPFQQPRHRAVRRGSVRCRPLARASDGKTAPRSAAASAATRSSRAASSPARYSSSASTRRPNGTSLSYSAPRPSSTSISRWSARARSSSSRRVLPMPASPASSRNDPSGSASSARWSCPSSRSRPTIAAVWEVTGLGASIDQGRAQGRPRCRDGRAGGV